MKIVITGHTAGIGKALYDRLTESGHELYGFSRSNGYDISDSDSREVIMARVATCDVFINNAYDPVGQTELLKEAIELWIGTDKTIVNISSKIVYTDNMPFLAKRQAYADAKLAQQKIINSLRFNATPKIINVCPGIVDTQKSKKANLDKSKKLNPTALAELLNTLIQYADVFLVQELVIDAPYIDYQEAYSERT